MSGGWCDTHTSDKHHISENTAAQSAHRFFFVEGDGEDVEIGGNPLGTPVVTHASRTSSALLLSMIPEDEGTESESSSSSSGGSSTGSSSSGDDPTNHSGGNGMQLYSRGGESALTWLRSDGAWRQQAEEESDIKDGESVGAPLETVVSAAGAASEGGGGVDKTLDRYGPSLDGADVLPSNQGKPTLWDFGRLFFRVLSFCNCFDLCNVMLVCKRFYQIATHDALWRGILTGMNLQPLLCMPSTPAQDYYRYFIDQIITTKALHGHYFFMATPSEDTWETFNTTLSSNTAKRTVLHNSPTILDDSVYPIEAVTLLLSSATIGQMYHTIGRVQLLIDYKDTATEVIQGAARFSWRRGCFMFCCSSFGSDVRGPVFTVAISTVVKPWPNQSAEQFEAHRDGLRLIMTPALLEGRDPGSRITETDLVCVSRPPISSKPAAQT
ncbi:hypothetical protein DQ04_07271020 [Trypanosoma grayi]|uniref:hypothetical protein n=1 Tax=Trypanosoma grayi TaxID=71804 RepID=UPI0004F46362|nr:hypothetical protein DQ04_07271020 [Trypanosoma grayi]KEG08402.1 hypothetical protein DQ04_07271020 [Trypanosoma grayi]